MSAKGKTRLLQKHLVCPSQPFVVQFSFSAPLCHTMSKRARRIAETNTAYEAVVVEEAKEAALAHKDEETLFVVDRSGSKAARKRVLEVILPQKEGRYMSASDKKVLQKIQAKTALVPAPAPAATALLMDVWADEPAQPSAPRRSTRQHKLSVPLPGQSYHPSPAAHQDVLAEALAVELARQEAEKEKEAPLLVRETRTMAALLVDEGEDTEGSEAEVPYPHPLLPALAQLICVTQGEEYKPRQKGKMSKAQRNRQRAHRISQGEMKRLRGEERLLQSIDKLDKVIKVLQGENDHQQAVRAAKEAIKATPVPVLVDVTAIPLSDELQGSLRTIRPKGVAVRDSVKSLVEAGDANAQQHVGRHKKAHPHKGKKIKWFPKYKC